MRIALTCMLLAGLSFLCGCSSGPQGPTDAPPSPTSSDGGVSAALPLQGSDVQVVSEPSGASVFLNGRLLGATPLRLPVLPAGLYSLRLERHGCSSHQRSLEMNGKAQVIQAKLPPTPTGLLDVKVKPEGAEVLLDGELVGLTPLNLDGIPAGIHELTIRKTNYRPYTTVLRIRPGQTACYADGDQPLLKDLILEMLDSLIRSEPHRASHLLDKGHYLFINNRMEEAARAFVRAEEVVSVRPEFPDDMPDVEREAEQELFADDRRRVSKEVARHRRTHYLDVEAVRDFNVAYEEAKRNRLLENVESWDWVAMRGRGLVGQAQYLQAIQLYETHLDHIKDGESAVPCALELMKVRLLLRDMSGFRMVFDRLCKLAENDPPRLLSSIRTVLPYRNRLRTTQRTEFLGLLSEPLTRIMKAAKPPFRAECAVTLGEMLALQGRREEAIPFLISAVKSAETGTAKEERSLKVAEALRLARRFDEAKEWYTRLAESPRESIRKRARAGLILLGVSNR